VAEANERKVGQPKIEAPLAFDALVERLEKVVGELEAGSLGLEQSIEKFAEGMRLAREAARKLDEAEKRIEILVRTEAGGEEARPLDPEAGKGP